MAVEQNWDPQLDRAAVPHKSGIYRIYPTLQRMAPGCAMQLQRWFQRGFVWPAQLHSLASPRFVHVCTQKLRHILKHKAHNLRSYYFAFQSCHCSWQPNFWKGFTTDLLFRRLPIKIVCQELKTLESLCFQEVLISVWIFKVLTSDLFSKSFDFTTHPAPLEMFLEIWQWLLMGEAGTWKHIRMMWWWWQNDLRLTNNWSRSIVNFQMFVWFSLCFWVTPCSFKLLWALATRWLPCTHLQLLPQDPILCWPYRYLQLLGPIPCEPRKLNPVKAAKKSDYLALAKLLLQRAPSMTTGRSVEFLVPLLQFGSMHFIMIMTFGLTKMFVGYLIFFFSAFWISIRVWGPYKSHSIQFQFWNILNL